MTPKTRPPGDNFPAVDIETREGGSTSSFVDQSKKKFVNERLPWAVIISIFCGFSTALSMFSWYIAQEAKRESRMTQYYLMDPHSRTPEELASWAKFQKEHER